MANLYHYLKQIEAGKEINYSAFIKCIERQKTDDFIDRHSMFKSTKVPGKKDKYQVEVLDNHRFNQLIAQHCIEVDTRIAAAQQGDSHKVATSYSYLLVFHDQLADLRPDIVVITSESILQEFTVKKQLLIIENEENFFRFSDMLLLLSDFYGQPLNLSNTDVVFGAGNQINKGLNLSFLGQYHSVLCAFDLDLGGLKMFSTLRHRLGENVSLLLPKDLSKWLSAFKLQPKAQQNWLHAITLADKLGFMGVKNAFEKTSCFMEQEVLLNNYLKGSDDESHRQGN
jgi:hypothetical protein